MYSNYIPKQVNNYYTKNLLLIECNMLQYTLITESPCIDVPTRKPRKQ